MFSSVSWSQYITCLAIATVTYCLFIWIVFFKAKLALLPGLSRIQTSMHAADQPDEVISTAQHVIDELRSLFVPDVNKNELFFALQQSLQKYNQWDEPGFRDTIDAFISRQCGTICSIRLSEDELRALVVLSLCLSTTRDQIKETGTSLCQYSVLHQSPIKHTVKAFV